MLSNKLAYIFLILLMTLSLIVYLIFFKNSSMHMSHMSIPMTMPEHNNAPHGYSMINIDPSRIQLLGIATEKIEIRALQKTVRSVGIVKIDETRKSVIQTKFSGWIEDLFVNFTEMPIEKNQPLFTVYSPELLTTQEEYLLALRKIEYDNDDESVFYNQSLLRNAQRRLELWDVPSSQIHLLKKNKKAMRTISINAPRKGIVLNKTAFIGMNVVPGMPIFTIADLSRVWIISDIYEQDIFLLHVGQKATINLSSLPDKTFNGTITFINYTIDAPTRTAKVRFECDNQNYLLKPGMYATINLQIQIDKDLALPEEALIDTGKRKIVFVDIGKGHYQPREVKIGYKADNYYQILEGLAAGESVVVSSQFLLDSESRIKSTGMSMGHSMEESK